MYLARCSLSTHHESGCVGNARPERWTQTGCGMAAHAATPARTQGFVGESGRNGRDASPPLVTRGGGTKWVVGPGVGRPGRKRWESADKPGSVEDNHPSGTHVAVRLERPTRKPLRAAGTDPKVRALPYLVLLQVGFAVPPNVATGAVRSYRTLSPLPATTRLHVPRHRRFAFCCTVRGLAPPRHYLAPCPMEPGLSSTSLNAAVAWPTPARSIRCRRVYSPGFGGASASASSYSSLRLRPVSCAAMRAACDTGNSCSSTLSVPAAASASRPRRPAAAHPPRRARSRLVSCWHRSRIGSPARPACRGTRARSAS